MTAREPGAPRVSPTRADLFAAERSYCAPALTLRIPGRELSKPRGCLTPSPRGLALPPIPSASADDEVHAQAAASVLARPRCLCEHAPGPFGARAHPADTADRAVCPPDEDTGSSELHADDPRHAAAGGRRGRLRRWRLQRRRRRWRRGRRWRRWWWWWWRWLWRRRWRGRRLARIDEPEKRARRS